jgi:drug/metabolite transporter (DMT)-like permease
MRAEARDVEPARVRLGWADVIILVTVTIWGGNFIVAKIALDTFNPLVFNALRYSLAVVLEVFVLFARGETLSMPWVDFRRLLPVALFGSAGFQVFFIFGLQYTTAGNSAMLMATVPIFVALYSALFWRQRLNALIWAGAVLTLIGILVLTFGSDTGFDLTSATLIGNLLILLASAGWAAYTVGNRSLLRVYSPLKVTALTMLISAPVVIILAVPGLFTTDWSAISAGAWSGVIYSGVLSLALAFLLWNTGVKRLGGTRAAIYSNMTPIISLAVAWVVLGEYLNLLQFVGVAVVLAGIWLARFAPGVPEPAAVTPSPSPRRP